MITVVEIDEWVEVTDIFSSLCKLFSNGGVDILIGRILLILNESDSIRKDCNVPCCCCIDKLFILLSPDWYKGYSKPPSLISIFCFFSADPDVKYLDCFESSSLYVSTYGYCCLFVAINFILSW